MPWSSTWTPKRRAGFVAGYLLAALLAGAEIVILMLALNPKVHPDYRAFYIDETTTCLNLDRVADYTLGEVLSFRQRDKRAESAKVCGWSGPAGDGTHSLGESSRLRLKVSDSAGSVAATLEMVPVLRPPQTGQRVIISVNGIRAHSVTLSNEAPQKVSFLIPQQALMRGKVLDIIFDYLDGIPPTPVASNIYKRSIKLLSLRLDAVPAGDAG